MLSHGVSYLMAQDDGQASLILGIWQQPLIDHDLASRHTEGIGALILHQIKLPAIVLHIGSKAILLEVSLHCRG